MPEAVTLSDVIGMARPRIDAHVLGVSRADELLRESGFKTVVAGDRVCGAFSDPASADNSSLIQRWLSENRISVLCFSYRLNVDDAVLIFRKLMYQLESKRLLGRCGGRIKAMYFAGLPSACAAIEKIYEGEVGVFCGGETARETLSLMGIDPALAPDDIAGVHPYDTARMSFGRDGIADRKSTRLNSRHIP